MKNTLFLGLGVLTAGLCIGNAADSDTPHPAKDVVLVEVGNTKITFADLQKKQPAAVFAADTSYYETERRALDMIIDDMLVQQQAAKEGLTVDQLFEKHVKSTLPPDPSEEALRVYFEGVDTTDSFDVIRPKILKSLQDRRLNKAKAAYMATLRKEANIVLLLPPPRAPFTLTGVPMRGPKNAPVVVTEFADFECPVCQQVQPIVDRIAKEFDGKVALAYKDFPLNIHANAEKAAEGSHCAEAQGKYWEYHDMMLDKKRTDVSSLKEFARDLKLDPEAFDKCLDSGAKADVVKKSLDEANTLNLNGTPTFFVNGRYVSGNTTYDKLKAVITEELSAAENQRTPQTQGMREK